MAQMMIIMIIMMIIMILVVILVVMILIFCHEMFCVCIMVTELVLMVFHILNNVDYFANTFSIHGWSGGNPF